MRKLLVTLLFVFTLSLPALASARIALSDTGLISTGEVANYDTNNATGGITVFIGTYIIAPILALIGVIFLLLMLYAGLLWMTAAGNSDQVKKAREIMVNSVIGLVIVTAAYALTAAIFNALTVGDINGSP